MRPPTYLFINNWSITSFNCKKTVDIKVHIDLLIFFSWQIALFLIQINYDYIIPRKTWWLILMLIYQETPACQFIFIIIYHIYLRSFFIYSVEEVLFFFAIKKQMHITSLHRYPNDTNWKKSTSNYLFFRLNYEYIMYTLFCY